MKATLNIILIISLFAAHTINTTTYCYPGGDCDKPYKTLLKCNSDSLSYSSYTPCVCKTDLTWDKDILDCIICWLNDLPNGGNAAQLWTSTEAQNQICCSDAVPSSANLTSCFAICRAAWQVNYACGGIGKQVESCICHYKYVWKTYLGRMADCPACIEKQGDVSLANTLRSWNDMTC